MKFKLSFQNDDEFPISAKTKEFFVSMFFDLPYEKETDLIYFIEKELMLEILKYKEGSFNKESGFCLDHGVCCGGGRFQQTITLPFVFESERQIVEWMEKKIQNSRSLSFSDCSEGYYSFVDAEDFLKEYNQEFKKESEEKTKKKEILKIISLEEAVFYEKLKRKLNDMFKETDIIDELLKNKLKK